MVDDKPETKNGIYFKKRMSAEKRHEQILNIARKLFAERGFHGTTTYELARAAGVSEALLFRHFKSKRDLYRAMLVGWIEPKEKDRINDVLKMECGSEKLVSNIYLVVSHIIGAYVTKNTDDILKNKLIYQSLLSDGALAGILRELMPKDNADDMRRSFEIAVKNGDADKIEFDYELACLATIRMLTSIQLSYPYSTLRDENVGMYIRQLSEFILRGFGFRDAALKKYLTKAEKQFKAPEIAAAEKK